MLLKLLVMLVMSAWLHLALGLGWITSNVHSRIALDSSLHIKSGQILLAESQWSQTLYDDLEELSRVVDIAYCVGSGGLGIEKPFLCASKCQDFPHFELIETWNTGPFLADSCGYIAVSHDSSNPRIIVAFRGTYSLANTIIDLSTIPQEYVPYPGGDDEFPHGQGRSEEQCQNCTVHSGFFTAWQMTRGIVLPHLQRLTKRFPKAELVIVGHSLGGALATLSSLEFNARGWRPQTTTFGEPRIGNKNLAEWVDRTFGNPNGSPDKRRFRRVTHIHDPVPMLPVSMWGYNSHADEIFIKKSSLPPNASDLSRCEGENDVRCSAGFGSQWSFVHSTLKEETSKQRQRAPIITNMLAGSSAGIEMTETLSDVVSAHRNYFSSLGLCLPA